MADEKEKTWYGEIEETITDTIKENHKRDITADKLQGVLLDIVDLLKGKWLFGGVVQTDSEVDITGDVPVFYLAFDVGTYTNFGNNTVASGEFALFMPTVNNTWQVHKWGIGTLLDGKVDAKPDYGLSKNDYTDEDKGKVDSLPDNVAGKSGSTFPEDNFASFDANGDIKDSGCNEGAFIKGVQKNGEDLPKDATTGKVNVVVQDGITPHIDQTTKEWMIGEEHTGVDAEGKDAYQLYAASVPSGTTPMTKTEWLASLKGEKGDNAVNPFKGWYDAITSGTHGVDFQVTDEDGNLPSNPVLGDYAYVKTWDIDSTQSPQEETPITKIYECTTTGFWSYSGRTVDTSNVQTFASTQQVNQVHIVDNFEGTSANDILSAKQGKILNDLLRGEGTVTVTEYKKIADNESITGTDNEYNHVYLDLSNLFQNYSQNKTRIGFVEVSQGDEIKITIATNSSNFWYYLFLTNKPPTKPGNYQPDWVEEYEDRQHMSAAGVLECSFTIPSGCEWLAILLQGNSDTQYNPVVYKTETITTKSVFGKLDDIDEDIESLQEVVDNLNVDKIQEVIDVVEGNKEEVTITEVEQWWPSTYNPDPEGGYSRHNGYFIYPGTWKGVSNTTNYKTTRIEVEGYDSVVFTGYIRVADEPTTIGYFFSDEEERIVGDFHVYDTERVSEEHNANYQSEYEKPIPPGAKYLVCVYVASNAITDFYCTKIKGSTLQEQFDALQEEVEELKNNPAVGWHGITHCKPENQGQLNAVRRMRKLVDIEWTPAFNIARRCSGGGAGGASNTSTVEGFEDVFLANTRYKGIPYARAYWKDGRTSHNDDGNGNYYDDYGYAIITDVQNNTSSDNTGFKIGFRISLETFITALSNRGTVMEMESSYNPGIHCAAFYANICAGSVSAALGKGYIATNNFDDGDVKFTISAPIIKPNVGDVYGYKPQGSEQITHNLFIGNVSTNGTTINCISNDVDAETSDNHATISSTDFNTSGTLVRISGVGDEVLTIASVTGTNAAYSGFSSLGRISPAFDMTTLKLGCVMAKNGVHTVMVTDIIKNDNDEITFIEVSESTTGGNECYGAETSGSGKSEHFTLVGTDREGGQLGGVGRRLWWTPEQFLEKWDGYKVLKCNSISDVPYIPSPYAPMPDEHWGYAQYSMSCLPYMGNGFRFNVNHMPDVMRKIVVTVGGKDRLHILKKDGDVWKDFTNIEITSSDYEDSNTGYTSEKPYIYVQLPDSDDDITPMTTGDYKAYVCKVVRDNGDEIGEVYKSRMCYWSVVDGVPNKLEDF